MNSRDKTLAILEKNCGKYVSGAKIAEELGISRNSVWKAVNGLRKDGYVIDAVTKGGYCLSRDTDIMTEKSVLRSLPPEFRDRLVFFDITESTNRVAKELAMDGAPHGTIVAAASQTKGKGRKSHDFFSPPGGIYISIILRPKELKARLGSVITAYTAVTVCETVHEVFGMNPGIKPINDVYLNNRKICGILTESGSDYDTGDVQWIVVGIGINYNTREELFPEKIRNRANSIFPKGDAPMTRSEFLGILVEKLKNGSDTGSSEVFRKYESLKLDISKLPL